MISKYAQNRKQANKGKIVKKALDLIPKCLGRRMSIYTVDESGAKTLRNDLLARAFLTRN